VGIAGDYSSVGAVTTRIYSCMGIHFLNESTKWCGLYHYPAQRLGNPRVDSTILSMYNQIKPERVLLTPAGDSTEVWSNPKDINALMEHLRNLGHAEVEQLNQRGWANFWWKEKLHLNEYTMLNEVRDGLAQFENTFEHQVRRVSTTVQYYGINAEKNKGSFQVQVAETINSVDAIQVRTRKSSKCNIF
jgi:hypothetical protein